MAGASRCDSKSIFRSEIKCQGERSTTPAPTGTKGPPRRSHKKPPPESATPAPTDTKALPKSHDKKPPSERTQASPPHIHPTPAPTGTPSLPLKKPTLEGGDACVAHVLYVLSPLPGRRKRP